MNQVDINISVQWNISKLTKLLMSSLLEIHKKCFGSTRLANLDTSKAVRWHLCHAYKFQFSTLWCARKAGKVKVEGHDTWLHEHPDLYKIDIQKYGHREKIKEKHNSPQNNKVKLTSWFIWNITIGCIHGKLEQMCFSCIQSLCKTSPITSVWLQKET